jgi:hypothetical protein
MEMKTREIGGGDGKRVLGQQRVVSCQGLSGWSLRRTYDCELTDDLWFSLDIATTYYQ